MRAWMSILLSLSLSAQAPVKPAAPDGALLAISEGGGQVRLLVWPPLKSPMPVGGWQVQDPGGKVLVPCLKAGDGEALKALPPEEALEAVKVQTALMTEPDPGRRRMLALNALVAAGTRPELGRALGMACALSTQAGGRRAYVAVGLDGSGKAVGPRLMSAEVDPAQASPLPPAPEGLRAEAGKEAVLLYWRPVKGGEIPVVDYRVVREEHLLTPQSNLLGVWNPSKPVFLDREAPGDQASQYRVWAVDIFGRPGPDAVAGVFFPDPATLRPPSGLRAQAEEGVNLLTFQPSPTRRSSGILLERAMTPTGPFELVTRQPLAPTTAQFSDSTVGGGATYYYRLRSVDADGNVGDPGGTTPVIARSKGRPAPPAGLRIKEGPDGNLVTWELPETPLAGFLLERRHGDGEWTRLGTELTRGDRYEDALADDVSGSLSYRVSAITFDNLQSEPSQTATVARADQGAPEPPVIEGADGAGGRTRLQFRPAAPEARTAKFLVLRAVRRTADDGQYLYGVELVVGDPLPESAREFTDSWVDGGETYRYRLVALSPEGVRSAIAPGVEVRVSPAPVPEPPVPSLKVVEQPFRQVQLTLPPIPEGFRAYVHRKAPGEALWMEVMGPFHEGEVVDPRPVSGHVQYRIHFEDARGLTGRSGAAAAVDIP